MPRKCLETKKRTYPKTSSLNGIFGKLLQSDFVNMFCDNLFDQLDSGNVQLFEVVLIPEMFSFLKLCSYQFEPFSPTLEPFMPPTKHTPVSFVFSLLFGVDTKDSGIHFWISFFDCFACFTLLRIQLHFRFHALPKRRHLQFSWSNTLVQSIQ